MKLTLEEKIGQMIIIKINDNKITSDVIKMIKDYKIGGVILYKRNYDSYEEMLTFINRLKEINRKYNKIPLFISIDQEGGRVNRFPKEIKNTLPSNKLINNKKKLEKTGSIIGKILYKTGINMNFAPVLDIQRFNDDHPIGDRCFGKTKEEVFNNGIIMMKELQKNSVIPVIKHFPGHGLINADSHIFLPVVTKKIETIENEDIYPFKKAINEGAEAIMVGHIILSKIDKFLPASLSKKVIKDYIIDKYNYKGLIITDDVKMKSIIIFYGYKKIIYKAINAHVDIILDGLDFKKVITSINYVKNKINNNIYLQNNIDNSVNKILRIKEKYKINDNEVKNSLDINELNKKIEKINNL